MRPGIVLAGCKRGDTTMKQGLLFTDSTDTEECTAPAQEDAQPGSRVCECAACTGIKLEVVCERTGLHPDCPFQDGRGAFNHCTLDGMPARIIGSSFHYATIEPLDLDAEPIRCCWQIVQDVLE